MTIFDNTEFKGPISMTGDGLPSAPGVYIVCTESAGSLKILGVYEGDNMCQSFKDNPKSDCWKKHMGNGLNIYYHEMDVSQAKRDEMCRKTIMNRWYKIECNDSVQDDF